MIVVYLKVTLTLVNEWRAWFRIRASRTLQNATIGRTREPCVMYVGTKYIVPYLFSESGGALG